MEPKDQRYDPMEMIEENITHAADYIDQEQLNTQGQNSWLDCLRTRINVIGMNLSLSKRQGQMSTEDYELYKERLDRLTTKTIELNGEFPEDNLPEDQRQKLLEHLNIFVEPEKEQAQE